MIKCNNLQDFKKKKMMQKLKCKKNFKINNILRVKMLWNNLIINQSQTNFLIHNKFN